MPRRIVDATVMTAVIGILAALFAPLAAPAAAAEICYEETIGTITRIVCHDDGTGGDDGGSGDDDGSGEVRQCHFGQTEISCETPAGIWNGLCYVKLVDPQPPFDDPVWQGRTDGVILQCTKYDAANQQCDADGGCPGVTIYWAPSPEAAMPSPDELARRAVAAMQLRPIGIGMNPPPSVDPPSLLINAPTHLFVADPDEQTTGPITREASDSGLTVTATGTLQRIEWSMGDGTVVTCEGAALPGSAWTEDMGWDEPLCGHRYEHTSADEPESAYTITATSYWSVEWSSSIGVTGEIPIELSSSVQVGVRDAPAHLVPGPSND